MDSLRRAAVVYNPDKSSRAKLETHASRFAGQYGWGATRWFPTSEDDPGAEAARAAMRAGSDVVLVAGGDGTVRAAAEALAGSDVPLAVLPQGTGNVFARNIGVRVSALSKAIEGAFSGTDRRVDIGEATLTAADGTTSTHVFLVACGIGIDAEIMAQTTRAEKRLLGWFGYVSAGARVLHRGTNVRTVIRVSGHAPLHTKASTTLVCNCGFLPGNVLLVPDAEIDDGRLDVLSVSPRKLTDWFGILRRILVEHHLLQTSVGPAFIQLAGTRRLRPLAYAQGPRALIVTETPREVEIDGDPIGTTSRLECRVRPDALLVRVPHR